MFYVYLSSIHKFDQTFNVNELNIFHDENRVFFLVLGQDGVEVCTTCREYNLVGFQCLTFASQCDIAECLSLQELRKHGLEV